MSTNTAKTTGVLVASFIAGLSLTALVAYADWEALSMRLFPQEEAELAAPPQLLHDVNSSWGPVSDPISGTVVIIAVHNEPLDWLAQQPFPYVVMTKGKPAGTPNNLVRNYGREAASYLQFITEHYDDLPPRMIFVHGHNASWHVRDMAGILRAIDPMSYEYVPVGNNLMWFFADNPNLVDCWRELNATATFGPLDPAQFILSGCCATFLVNRERVRMHSKAFYDHMFNWVLTTQIHDSISGRCMEWIWHKIFGQPWWNYAWDPTILCPKDPAVCALDNLNAAHSRL